MGAREEKIVLDFIGDFRDSWPTDLEKTLQALAEDGYYQICVPTLEPVRGRAAVLAKLRQMQGQGCEDQKHELINVGSSGKTVFLERVDQSKRNGKWSAVPLAAVFEVNEAGKIVAWREYLDMANIARSHGMPAEGLVESLKEPVNA
jgi:limonene-1,2-epoxide hydrolase